MEPVTLSSPYINELVDPGALLQLMGPDLPICNPQGRFHSAWREIVFSEEDYFGIRISVDLRLPGQAWVGVMRASRAVRERWENFILAVAMGLLWEWMMGRRNYTTVESLISKGFFYA
jgi:hypothetical protein